MRLYPSRMRRSAKTAVTLRQCTRSPPNIEPTPEVQGQHSLEGLAIRGSSHSGAICIFWSCRRAGAIGTIATATAESVRRCLLGLSPTCRSRARGRDIWLPDNCSQREWIRRSSEVSCGELGRESDKEMMPTEWQRAIECRVATELRTGAPNPRSRSFRKSCAEIIQGLLLLQRSPAIIWLLDTPSRSAQLPNAPHASSAQHASQSS